MYDTTSLLVVVRLLIIDIKHNQVKAATNVIYPLIVLVLLLLLVLLLPLLLLLLLLVLLIQIQ